MRKPNRTELARALAARSSGPSVDLGCGPGWHAGLLPEPVVALDGALAMLRLVGENVPTGAASAGGPRGAAVPARRRSRRRGLATATSTCRARASRPRSPTFTARSRSVLQAMVLVLLGEREGRNIFTRNDFPDRFFSQWDLDQLLDVVVGAGFDVDGYDVDGETEYEVHVRLTRARTLPDLVGPDMRLLVCGLNPSLYAADAGIGFARPGNRFWPAALAAGIASRDRDPWHAFRVHGVGFTDLVKRATVGADELTKDEYRAGYARVERLVAVAAARVRGVRRPRGMAGGGGSHGPTRAAARGHRRTSRVRDAVHERAQRPRAPRRTGRASPSGRRTRAEDRSPRLR